MNSPKLTHYKDKEVYAPIPGYIRNKIVLDLVRSVVLWERERSPTDEIWC